MKVYFLLFVMVAFSGCSLFPCLIPDHHDFSVREGYIQPFRPNDFSRIRGESDALFCEGKKDCVDREPVKIRSEDQSKIKLGSYYHVELRGYNQYRCSPGAADMNQGHLYYEIVKIKEEIPLY